MNEIGNIDCDSLTIPPYQGEDQVLPDANQTTGSRATAGNTLNNNCRLIHFRAPNGVEKARGRVFEIRFPFTDMKNAGFYEALAPEAGGVSVYNRYQCTQLKKCCRNIYFTSSKVILVLFILGSRAPEYD